LTSRSIRRRRQLGAGDQQIVDYADIFGYDIDFQREVRTGDRFGMLYETFEDERGQQVKTGDPS
jgi:hypothetical protein